MPISTNKWNSATKAESTHQEILEFLDSNSNKAYTIEEIRSEVQPLTTDSSTEKVVAQIAIDVILQTLVWEGEIDRRKLKSGIVRKSETVYYKRA